MKLVTDYVTALADYLKLELASFKRGAVKAVAGVGVMACAGVIALLGVLLVLLSVFLAIARETGYPAAALLTGVIMLILAAICAGVATWLAR